MSHLAPHCLGRVIIDDGVMQGRPKPGQAHGAQPAEVQGGKGLRRGWGCCAGRGGGTAAGGGRGARGGACGRGAVMNDALQSLQVGIVKANNRVLSWHYHPLRGGKYTCTDA